MISMLATMRAGVQSDNGLMYVLSTGCQRARFLLVHIGAPSNQGHHS
jgi:hypothetical protein